MKRFDLSKHITRFVMFVLTGLSCLLLTSSAFAFVAIDDHAPENIDVWASVYLDRLEYDPAASGGGVVYLDGSFGVYNINAHRRCGYTFEVRLEIFKYNPEADDFFTLRPDAKTNPLISGTLEKAAEPWENFAADGSDSKSLHLSCVGGGDHKAGDRFKAKATVTLNVTQHVWTEPWQITEFELDFTYRPPEADEEEIHGIGSTDDGETFSGDCTVDEKSTDPEKDEWTTWQSLIITEIPYDRIYWYKKAPGDTSTYGSLMDIDYGDGVQKRATMTTGFPWDVGGQFEEGVYYEIGALVYRSDGDIEWNSYQVWVKDR